MADRFGAFLPHDTSGDVAQLHGIGLQKFGDTWYAYGENKVNGNLFQGVCCYTTTDFIAWRSHGIVLDVQEDGSALAADRIGERPKVLHCPATGKYVMYIHAETPDYGYAHIGVAVADAPTGPFAFQTTITWRGYLSRDIGVFQDEDGSGYEARFTTCGICTLMQALGLYDLTPALCHLDYTMSDAGGASDFVREYTLASGGPYCDCGYHKKQ